MSSPDQKPDTILVNGHPYSLLQGHEQLAKGDWAVVPSYRPPLNGPSPQERSNLPASNVIGDDVVGMLVETALGEFPGWTFWRKDIFQEVDDRPRKIQPYTHA